jgi:hypothetical protein
MRSWDDRTKRHVRLLLDDAIHRIKRTFGDRMKAYDDQIGSLSQPWRSESSLQSVATIEEEALDNIEELANRFVAQIVDSVAEVARDTEASVMIREATESLLSFLRHQLDDIVQVAARELPAGGTGAGVYNTYARFEDLCLQVRRQLDLCEFEFTAPAPLSALDFAAPEPIKVPKAMPPKNSGGRPLAKHWDEMWASIALALYTGDLQPKTQADIERAIQEWLGDHDLEAGPTAVRGRARQLWCKWKEAQ